MRRVLLIGNGLSIAANAGYALGPLTTAVGARLDTVQIGDRSAREHLELIGQRLEADGRQDPLGSSFERLIGPLDRLQGLISAELGAVVGALRPDLRPALEEVGDLVRDLYVRGVGAVLTEIDALDATADLTPVTRVVRWATGRLGHDDRVVVYTVNYDPLLDRVLLGLRTEVIRVFGLFGRAIPFQSQRYSLADEFSGLAADATAVALAPGTDPITALSRRSEPYLRGQAVDLVHLHGGQHWFRAAGGLVQKTELDALRAADVYGRWMRGDPIDVKPAVVLTDQKSQAVLHSPFVDAYTRLRHDLLQADRVAILGYGFGDEPLNERLRSAFGRRPPGSVWLINRNACGPEAQANLRAGLAAVFGVAVADLPEVLFRALPTVTTEYSDFFA